MFYREHYKIVDNPIIFLGDVKSILGDIKKRHIENSLFRKKYWKSHFLDNQNAHYLQNINS